MSAQLRALEDFGYGSIEPEITFSDPNQVDRGVVRWIFFAGDVIDAQTKFEREDLAFGGEVIDTPCMWRFRRFLRKGVMTPLEVGVLATPAELVPEGTERVPILQAPSVGLQERGWHGDHVNSPTYGIKYWPSEQLAWILTRSLNVNNGLRKGIVEITAVRGWTFDEMRDSGLQKFFFPTVPAKLREMEQMIKSAMARDLEPEKKELVEKIGQDMLTSCAQFKHWGTQRVETENAMLSRGPIGDFIPQYSGVAEILFEQLELTRKDHEMRNQADFNQRIAGAIESLALRQSEPAKQITAEELLVALRANPDVLTQLLAQTTAKGRKAKSEQ
jgi:hypothetical protein